jgi:hypothetical protein
MPGNGERQLHHGSHRNLLDSAAGTPLTPEKIDAIFVPTFRSPAYLTKAARLSVALACPLVTLHSGKWTSAAEAVRRLPPDVDLIAIDVPDRALLRLPAWATSDLLDGTVFARKTDLSTKRNLALVLSRLVGWDRILFLDDDITQLDPADMRRASGLLSEKNAVGLHVTGFPDHSVVCHAYRQAGGEQEAFIGGGAMAVAVGRSSAFFPDIYNDDWFFLLDENGGLQPIAVTGTVRQSPYDPFRNEDRARAEELGDVLAEGIFWLLDQGRSLAEADEEYWAGFLVKRRQFIGWVLEMVKQDRDLHPEDRQRRITALSHGSMFRLKAIKPDLCAGYLRAWAEDRKRWEFHLDQLPAGLSPATAIGWLPADGQSPLSYRLRRAPRVRNRPPLLRDPAVPPVPATLPVPAALPAPTDLPAPAALDPAVALVEAAPGVLAAAGAGG